MDTLLSSRPPLEYLKPFDKSSYRNLEGIIERDRNYPAHFEDGPPPEPSKVESYRERKEREWKEEMIEHRRRIEEKVKDWKPKLNSKATHDPYKTLFVSNLDKTVDEMRLRRVFLDYGDVKKVVIVKNLNGVSKGYAFIEFTNYEDYKSLLFNYL